jgi:hypothetical protein
MNPNVPNASVLNVTLALGKVHHRMHPRMPRIAELIGRHT